MVRAARMSLCRYKPFLEREKSMKKLLQIGTVFFCLIMTSAFAQDAGCCPCPQGNAAPTAQDNGQDYTSQEAAPGEHACDQPVNDCWCKYVRYNPCYYYTKRCVQDCIPCQRTCCRMVPQYYQVQKCRYVPQYYCEQACRQVPEYYTVCETKTSNRMVCDKHCRWVPQYYWKHTCGDAGCTTPAPSQPADAGCGCPR